MNTKHCLYVLLFTALMACESEQTTTRSSDQAAMAQTVKDADGQGVVAAPPQVGSGTPSSHLPEPAAPDVVAPRIKVYSGYDLDGNQAACPIQPLPTVCSTLSSPSDRFAAKCKEAGHEVFSCDCHTHLCSQKLAFKDDVGGLKALSGFDASGQQTSCVPMDPASVCPAIFGPSDQYANACKDAGFNVISCSCKVNLCSQKVPNPLVR